MAISTKLRCRVDAMADELRRELYGKKGHPALDKSLADIEQEAVEVGDAITCTIMQEVLRSLAETVEQESGEQCTCAVCGRSAEKTHESEARYLQTRRGDVGWREPKYQCNYRKCRKAFFPSVQGVGH